MPDGAVRSSGADRRRSAAGQAGASAPRGWVSPLLRRILLVNALPLALLVVGAAVSRPVPERACWRPRSRRLREQARIYAGALGESAVRTTDRTIPSWCRIWRGRCCAG